MKLLKLYGIFLFLAIGSCKKNDVNFDKYNNTKIKPEVLTPLASARIVASDFLKQDSIIKYDPDGLIRFVFKQDSVFAVNSDTIFNSIALGSGSSRYSVGALDVSGAEENSSVDLNDLILSLTQPEQDFIKTLNGSMDTFPSFSTDKIDITPLAASADFIYLKIAKGHIVFTIDNGFPTELADLEINIFDSVNTANPALIGTVKFNNIPAFATAVDSINVGSRTVSNALGYNVPIVNFSKSTDEVLVNLNDKISLNVSYNNFRCIGGKAKIPQQKLNSKSTEIDLSNPKINAFLRNIEFGNAIVPVKITSSFKTDLSVILSLPDATKNGMAVAPTTLNVPNGVTNTTLDLSNTKIFLGSSSVKEYNMLQTFYQTTVLNTDAFIEFDSSDYIDFEIDASKVKFEYLDGYLGQDTFEVAIDNLDVSQLAELGKGIRMENPKMRIFVNNSFGIPILVELDITSKDKTGNSLPMNVQEMLFPYPSISERGTVKSENFEINKNNSDIVECLGMPAVLFDVKGRVITNPDGFTGYTNHIARKSTIDLGFNADIPMTFTAQNFAYTDTLDQGGTLQGLSDFDLLELKIKTLNGFPLGGTLDLIFTDSSYKVIDSLVNVTLLQSAVVDTDGRILKSSENMSTFLMPGEMLDKLDAKKCEYILIRTNFSSYDKGSIPVSIYTSCALDISLAFRAIYTSAL